MKFTLEEFRKARRANRVELESHEVELGVADDIKNIYESANKMYKSNTDSLNKFATQIENSFQKTADEYKRALDKYNSFEKQVKDLGLDVPSDIVKMKSLIEYGLNDSLNSKSNSAKILTI